MKCFKSTLKPLDCTGAGLLARLVNGTSPHSGRLEVQHDGEWSTVCEDGFGAEEARVACRMLGLDRSVQPLILKKNNNNIFLRGHILHQPRHRALVQDCTIPGRKCPSKLALVHNRYISG